MKIYNFGKKMKACTDIKQMSACEVTTIYIKDLMYNILKRIAIYENSFKSIILKN